MNGMSPEAWVGIGLIASACALGLLSVIAGAIRDGQRLSAFNRHVKELQDDYARRLKAMQEEAAAIAVTEGPGAPGEFDIIDAPARKAA